MDLSLNLLQKCYIQLIKCYLALHLHQVQRKEFRFMKIKNLLTGFLAACAMTLLLSGTAMAASFAGHVDGADGACVNGWAWDAEAPETPVQVTVTVTSTDDGSVFYETTVVADQYREDLQTALNQSGSHAFTAYLDWSQAGEGEYRIQASTNGVTLSHIFYYKEGSYSRTPFAQTVSLEGKTLVPMGTFKTTAYCPCASCSEGWGRSTSTGATATAGRTIAVDPRILPYGSQLMINGIVYTAEDCGGGVKSNHIDIFFDTHSEARQYGVRNVEVYLLS